MKRFFIFFIFLICAGRATAQDKPIGYWQSHLPYNRAIGITTDGTNIYTACPQSLFTYTNATGDMYAYSKTDGMSDIGMKGIGYDIATSTAILAYQDGNIDLLKDNTFYNIPDFKNEITSSSKIINGVYSENGYGYLSTSLGILVLDLTNKLIAETYQFTINGQILSITGFYGAGDYFYAITQAGFYRAMKNSQQLQNFAIWQRLDSTRQFTGISAIGNNLFVANNDSVFSFNADTLIPVYTTSNTITHLDATSDSTIWITEAGANNTIKKLNGNYQITGNYTIAGTPKQVAQLLDGTVFVADSVYGMQKITGQGNMQYVHPDGPNNPGCFDIYAHNKNILVAHGGYTGKYLVQNNSSGFSNLVNGQWKIYSPATFAPMAGINDINTILKDEKTGTIYAGSFEKGLFVLNTDSTTQDITSQQFDPSAQYGAGTYSVVGLALDHEDNLWLTTFTSSRELHVKTADSGWKNFKINYPSRSYPSPGGPMIIDDNDQQWYVCLGDGGNNGVIVYNDGGTPLDSSDDASFHLQAGVGAGNLPANIVYSIVKDNNDNIWIGTANGIGIVNCASGYTASPCDADIPIVQYDQFANYLFVGENVRTIAVDGANRKWVGTDNGVWLLSPDASKIVYRFTVDNSPLPSNLIQKIAIDPVTGDVYIGTQQGLITYHSNATEGGTTNSNVKTYPNPVPSGYNGTISIKGVVANADVRITDISGQLVYKTTALGGQAVWDGKDYTGHRPQTGVYLIFVTNSDGTQTYTGKMVFMN